MVIGPVRKGLTLEGVKAEVSASLSPDKLELGLFHLQVHLTSANTPCNLGTRLACESWWPQCDWGEAVWEWAWPKSRSSFGALSEARDRPRSASGALGKRLEVTGGGVGWGWGWKKGKGSQLP